MTPELHGRWKSGTAPFDGQIVATCDEPDLATLLEILVFASTRLEPHFPRIHTHSDWHEHDGFVATGRETSWAQFSQRLGSESALYETRDDDDLVRIAIAPDSLEWLLRYNIDAPDGANEQAWCDLDFTASNGSRSADLIREINHRWPGYTDVHTAKSFFDNSYGG